ncbi:Glucose--fructose oxidoreductase precursor [Sphingomonas paucimobilis]|nr:Glucose--fructose oxidoreductase precursor [Sphingomonas paucimobilis]
MMAGRKLKLAMAGGGEGAFIGGVHRMAAVLDGDWELVAGAFSSDPARNWRTGEQLGLDPARVHDTLDALLADERARPEAERIDAVAIVTPNHLHAPMAIAALDAGFPVFSEKPMAMNLAEAQAIAEAARASGQLYALAFTYSGYPLVEEARARVARGDFGAIRLVHVEYVQGWLSSPLDREGNKQAEWRTDPARAGLGGALGDIGTHAFQLAEHVSGLKVEALSADVTTHVAGRMLDDDVNVLLRFADGVRGTLRATQVAAGEENGLRLRIHGEKGGLEWSQMEPNTLTLRWLDRPAEIVRAGGPGLSPTTLPRLRIPRVIRRAISKHSATCTARSRGRCVTVVPPGAKRRAQRTGIRGWSRACGQWRSSRRCWKARSHRRSGRRFQRQGL